MNTLSLSCAAAIARAMASLIVTTKLHRSWYSRLRTAGVTNRAQQIFPAVLALVRLPHTVEISAIVANVQIQVSLPQPNKVPQGGKRATCFREAVVLLEAVQDAHKKAAAACPKLDELLDTLKFKVKPVLFGGAAMPPLTADTADVDEVR